jgi:hypothetical protein
MSSHTRFAEYMSARWPVPERLIWRWLRWFHKAGSGTMTSTASLADELGGRGFKRALRWPRGVDARLFRPRADARLGLLRPIFLTVGRLAVEKSIGAFLALDLPGTTVVVGGDRLVDQRDVVVVGAGAAGMMCAARAGKRGRAA